MDELSVLPVYGFDLHEVSIFTECRHIFYLLAQYSSPLELDNDLIALGK